MPFTTLLQRCFRLGTLLMVLASGPGLAWADEPGGESVNINSASAEQISAALKGVGIKRAQAIVAWREKNGHFSDLSQLTEIKGIGDKILARNSSRIALE